MSTPEFDRFAQNYRDIHARNISLTGEAPEYFASYKMKDFVSVLDKYSAPRGGLFLDFGSGVGSSVRPFLDLMPEARLVCADVSPESLSESRAAHGDRVSYMVLQDGRIAVDDDTVDGAFACCVFHHIPPEMHASALAELHRILTPGAPLMLYEHNPYNPLTVRAVNTCPLDENAILISASEMRRRCLRAGFRDVRIEYRVFFPAPLRVLRGLEGWLRWLPLGAQYAIHGRA